MKKQNNYGLLDTSEFDWNVQEEHELPVAHSWIDTLGQLWSLTFYY